MSSPSAAGCAGTGTLDGSPDDPAELVGSLLDLGDRGVAGVLGDSGSL